MSEPEHGTAQTPVALRTAAFEAARRGDLASAVAMLRRAQQLDPRDIETIVLLGDMLRRAGELDEARAVIETGKTIAPNEAALAFQLGMLHRTLGQTGSARREFEFALQQQPENTAWREALVRLEIAERNYAAAGAAAQAAILPPALQSELLELICIEAVARGDIEPAQTYGRSAFERQPNARTAMTLARADYHADADADADQRLQWILRQPDTDLTLRARAVGTLADIADRRGDVERAFQNYRASKLMMKEAYERSSEGRPGSFRALVDRLAAAVAQAPDPAPRPAHPPATHVAGHVFLLGFPRTGTTLLEQCLAGHPDIVTSDEIDALRSAVVAHLSAPNPFAAVQTASGADLGAMREAYWRRIDQRAPAIANTVFVDKMPFNSVFAGFIPLLFPAAKVIFAIRDPRDVVFSCFRRRFGMNSATYEFCTLEGSVGLFCAVMRLFDLSRAKLPSPSIDCRYEDIVRDLKGTVSHVCEFMGVDWREDMAKFSERAKRRPLSTVSAPQLTQGLYDGGDSWRRYRGFLAPHYRELAPWIARFGYPPDAE